MRWPEIDKRSTRTVPRQFVSDYEEDGIKAMSEEVKAALPSSSGVLKFFLIEKGYGFISREGAVDIFIHINALKKSSIMEAPPAGTKLSFDLEPVEGKAPQAVNIKVIP